MTETTHRRRRARTSPAQAASEAKLSATQKSIRGKRRSSSRAALLDKKERGELHGKERALVRVGPMNTKILLGEEDLSEWSIEELRAGRRLSKDGTFNGRVPTIVPKALHDELVRRTLSEAERKLRDSLDDAVTALTDLVSDPKVDAKDRLKAAGMIMDRVMGKGVDKVEVTAELKPWEKALTGGIVAMDPEDLGHSMEDFDDDVDDVDDEPDSAA